MGRILGPDRLIRAKDAEVGDLLIVADGRTRSTGIVFEFDEDRDPLVGILEAANEVPYLMRVDSRELCADYGAGWIIEPIEQPSDGPGIFEAGRRAGLLVLTRSTWVMNFATSGVDQRGRFSSEWRDLMTGARVVSCDRGLVHDRWRLWARAEDRALPAGSVLVTYGEEMRNKDRS